MRKETNGGQDYWTKQLKKKKGIIDEADHPKRRGRKYE